MTSFGFRVFGTPVPQGSKIPGVSRKTGKMFVREQGGEALTSWREAVKAAAIIARGDSPTLTGAVRININFLIPRPASISVKKRPYPIVAPDLDKLVRGVGDALTQVGVFKDDAQIVAILATKTYGNDSVDGAPGAWIVISEVPVGAKLL